jgi:hypothetical protein
MTTTPLTPQSDVPVRERTSADLLWIGLALFVILTIAFLLPIPPNDYWWYVRIGQDTVRARAVPTVDTLSYTQADQPVVYHAWLSAVLYWTLNEAGGVTLTILAHGLVLATFYVLVWLTCRRAGAGPKLAAVLTLLAALAGSNNWAVRPQIFAYPLFGLALWALWRWQQGQKNLLWLLPLITLAWVNLHGSFVLIFLLTGAALLAGEGDRRALVWTLIAMVAASWLNPLGPAEWISAFSTIGNPSNQLFSMEWGPPINTGWQMNLFFGWLLLFAPLVALSPARLSRLHWLWFAGLGWLALSGVRYVVWFLALLPCLSARLLAPTVGARLDRPVTRGSPVLNRLIVALLLALPLALLPGVRERWWPDAPPALASNTPVAAIRWLAQRPDLPGPLWSDFAFASYLTYVLPERPVWIDSRFYPFPPEQWQRYLEISNAAPGWETLLAEDDVALVLIDLPGQDRLRRALEQSPHWCQQYRDDVAAIFSRRALDQPCTPTAD